MLVPAVEGVRLHDLRHTFATLQLSAGVHFMQVSKWLGHSTFTLTLDVYGDWIPEQGRPGREVAHRGINSVARLPTSIPALCRGFGSAARAAARRPNFRTSTATPCAGRCMCTTLS
jgi:hypothetical protein